MSWGEMHTQFSDLLLTILTICRENYTADIWPSEIHCTDSFNYGVLIMRFFPKFGGLWRLQIVTKPYLLTTQNKKLP